MNAESAAGAVSDAPAGNLVDRYAPPSWRPFLRMARIDRPIGWELLLAPCWWSAALAAVAAGLPGPDPFHIFLFWVGAIAMRGAGSAWNDLVDRDLDAKVERTRSRPIPSGQVTPKQAAVFLVALALVGLAVLLTFNRFTIIVGLCSLLPVVIYPFMKRVTSFPQVVLGMAFAWGGLMGWAAIFGRLDAPAFLIYAAAIAWTFGYDTIYALQDIEDDVLVGIGSTARFFGDRAREAVAGAYALTTVLIAISFALTPNIGWPSWLGLAGFALHLSWQVKTLDLRDPRRALALFKSNRDSGLILFAGLVLDGLV
ncbi:4-hydroxybenzoate octaprenyltransferase [Terrarubrum flagellatum]|uniref:4-hydroxybenzoate octaprenyltransferase n=1 Tax=Terrirubrum flagellatum TaxID=2895980 RepID=UPI003144E016